MVTTTDLPIEVVSNLQQTAGIVGLEANSEDSQLIVAFNQDTVTVDEIIAQINMTGDEVTDVELQ
ncbi:MAG: hypothetical protein ACE5FD_00360 [Anaerolineae bacterium]